MNIRKVMNHDEIILILRANRNLPSLWHVENYHKYVKTVNICESGLILEVKNFINVVNEISHVINGELVTCSVNQKLI